MTLNFNLISQTKYYYYQSFIFIFSHSRSRTNSSIKMWHSRHNYLKQVTRDSILFGQINNKIVPAALVKLRIRPTDYRCPMLFQSSLCRAVLWNTCACIRYWRNFSLAFLCLKYTPDFLYPLQVKLFSYSP